MKTPHFRSLTVIPLAAAALSSASCIYESPTDDEFYRTLWETSEEPFEELTIEFLCDNNISAQAENAAGSFGTYESYCLSAYFSGLKVIMDEKTIFIEEAHRTDDLMKIIWHYEGSSTAYATSMTRLSAYR